MSKQRKVEASIQMNYRTLWQQLRKLLVAIAHLIVPPLQDPPADIRKIRHLSHIAHIGVHVAGWGAIVLGQKSNAEEVKQRFLANFTRRKIPNVEIMPRIVHLKGSWSTGREMLTLRMAAFASDRIEAIATVLVEATPSGDLLAGWLLFERNKYKGLKWHFLAIAAIVLGFIIRQEIVAPIIEQANQFAYYATGRWPGYGNLFTEPIFYGFLVACYCWGRAEEWWGRLYKYSPANPYERFEGAILARYVDLSLKETLSELDIDGNDVLELNLREEQWMEVIRERPNRN